MRQGIFTGLSFTAPGDGTALSRHAVTGTRPEAAPDANFFEPRQTPSALGLGLLERIPREAIEALADPSDDDDDGIAGRAHVLEDGRLGRFGWKANVPSIRDFVRDALSGELGLTVRSEPGLSFGSAEDDDDAADPEADETTIDSITGFIALLAPPPRSRVDAMLEDSGEEVFNRVGCGSCHVPVLQTRDGDDVHAYTDLLLHDVAEPNALGIEEGDAGIHDFRTPPLWGLGRTAPYLHDGRASTIEAAIAMHAGEAATTRDELAKQSADDREALLAFLRSL